MTIIQPRNPVASLPKSDDYMDNWCNLKCRKVCYLPNLNYASIALSVLKLRLITVALAFTYV